MDGMVKGFPVMLLAAALATSDHHAHQKLAYYHRCDQHAKSSALLNNAVLYPEYVYATHVR